MLKNKDLMISLIIFCTGLTLFLWGISGQEVIGFDSRFYFFAQEMWQHGFSIFPTAYGDPYPDYPGSSTLIIYLTALGLGGLSKWVAVFPTALLAALTLVITYQLGCLHDRKWGICAVLLLLVTIHFLKSARAIALDFYPTFITACCFYLIYTADQFRLSKRVWWIYPLLLLAMAFRGPIGLVMASGVICAYYLVNRQFKKLFLTGGGALLVLVLGSSLLLALAYYVGGETFLHQVIRMQVLGRLGDSNLPFYYYFANSLQSYALSFPIACLVAGGVLYYSYRTPLRRGQLHFLLTLCAWVAVILIGMSIPGDKKARYLLPMAPALALLASYPFIAEKRERYFYYLRVAILQCFAYLPLLLLVLMICLLNGRHSNFNIDINYISTIAILIIAQAVNWLILFAFIKTDTNELVMLFISTLSFVLVYLNIVEPIELHLEEAREIVTNIELGRKRDHAALAFYKEHRDYLPIKYLINLSQPVTPLFINDEQALLQVQQPTYFVTSKINFDALPNDLRQRMPMVVYEKMAHKYIVVFTLH